MLTPSTAELRVGGLTRLSSVDWPGELAATVFTQGCPWDCLYCHNPHLLPADGGDPASDTHPTWRSVVEFLSTREGLLDGVVFTGGEPLAQAALGPAIEQVRALGFRVALHTSGVMPARFAEVLPLVDWVGFDAKAPFDGYEGVTNVANSGARARESLGLLVGSGTSYEVRTTVHPDLLGAEDLLALAAQLADAGVRRWVLQPFRTQGARPEAAPHAASPLTDELLGRLAEKVAGVRVRA